MYSYADLKAELTNDPLGRGYAGMTGTAAATSLNTTNRPAPVQRVKLAPSAILNAIVPADLAALTQLQTLQLSLFLAGSEVDASIGTTVRLAIQTLFAGKTTTLNQLGALVAPFDTPPQISRASEIGWPGGVSAADVNGARAL